MDKNIQSWDNSANSSYSNFDYLVDGKNIRNLLSDKTFLVRDSDSKRKSYSIYFAIENNILEIENNHSFVNEPDIYDIKSNWNNNFNSCIESYLSSQICIDSYIFDDSVKYNDSGFTSYFFSKNDFEEEGPPDYSHLWVRCDNDECSILNYKPFFKNIKNICQYCGQHLKMNSSDRLEILIDPGTWNPMDEYMVSEDPIEWDSEEDPYKDKILSCQESTGLYEAIQTGTGQINGIPLAIGFMEFEFIGGSMGSVVGEKITRLIEYATNQRLPLILICASGGARMQEGSLSLMQMAKISSALYEYQINQKLFYISILTSPTTGGVTASFGMLGDIVLAEPDAYIAFAGKRVIEETLKIEVPEGVQSTEFLFDKGLFDSVVPRTLLKPVLTELFLLHGFLPLTPNAFTQKKEEEYSYPFTQKEEEEYSYPFTQKEEEEEEYSYPFTQKEEEEEEYSYPFTQKEEEEYS